MPSATVEREHLTLVSSLRAQGFSVEAPGTRAPAATTFLVADGEAMAAPARTLIVGSEGRTVLPFRDGQPARIAYGHADAAVGNAFARALVGGPELPTAADPETLALLALAERVAQADIT
ncbi:hypothetical protein LTR94_033661, partial [Friedmanniomyces endolithicus]